MLDGMPVDLIEGSSWLAFRRASLTNLYAPSNFHSNRN